MPYRTFAKLTAKAFRFAVNRPMQRFNIYNRMKKYLGPDAKNFAPAPRAIGALSQSDGKPLQYPHLESGYKSIAQRRAKALSKVDNDHVKLAEPQSSQSESTQKAFSESKNDDRFVIGASNQLEVTKTISKIEQQSGLETGQIEQIDNDQKKKHRPLPKLTNLPLQDLTSIWLVEKTPPGRLSISQLQEIMINKLGDDKYWTPKAIADKYSIKEEYAESLLQYMKQIRIVVSPRMARAIDYAGMDDPNYQAAKHLVYHVDNSLRTEIDKKYDDMFLPDEDWDDEVTKLLDQPKSSLEPVKPRMIKRPEPLRIGPVNKPKELASTRSIDERSSAPPKSTDRPDSRSSS